MRLKIFFTNVFWVAGFFTIVFAQSTMPVRHLGIENGLSNNSLRCIFQDKKGFMWFGTFDGLNRYDGYEFNIFRHTLNDSLSLPHNYINVVGEDLHNNIWVGTPQGMVIYNELRSNFSTAFFMPTNGAGVQRINFNINNIECDANDNLYIGTNGGGLLVAKGGKNVAIQIPFLKDGNGNDAAVIQSVIVDKQQRIWVFILHVGLCLYDPNSSRVQLVSKSLANINCMEADDLDNIWLGTEHGLYKYNIINKSMELSYSTKIGRLTDNSVVSLAFDKQKRLWIGTQNGGVNIYHSNSKTVTYIYPGEDKNMLSSESVYAIFEDREHRIWMGTLKGGINIIESHRPNFETIAHNHLTPNGLKSSFISAFYEDSSRNLYIGTDGGGLSYWNRSLNKFTNYFHEQGNSRSLSHNIISNITEDYKGDIWVGTFGEGINKFNPKTGLFMHYPCINEAGEENKLAWILYEDREQNLWATTYSNGRLYKLDRQLDRFVVFVPDFIDLFSLKEDRKGRLWAGHPYGLVQVNKVSKSLIYYDVTKPVRAICEDKKGRFWLGTEAGGLLLFDQEKGEIIQRYTTSDGLCNNSVLNILEDKHGMLWLSTFHGLSKFDPAKKTFTNYYQEDGLQSNQFSFNAGLRLQSGELVFGGIKGLNVFYPDSMVSRSYFPPIQFTGLQINNARVSDGSDYIHAFDGDQISVLRIPFDDAVLSFDFAALEYFAPGKISYAWYLEGWDKGWNYTTQRTAYYSRLNEGKYTLRIKSTNAAGEWNPNETTLQIIVLPPWYRSWWAYLLYAALVGSVAYMYLRYRRNKAALQYEVQIAHFETEKEKELNEKKLNFFTNVSHEFRTPLTLIINPIKDLLYNKNSHGSTTDLNVVYRNAKRLLSLVDQLLLFRKADREADQVRISKANFNNLCHEVFLCFIQQAKSKNLQYSFQEDPMLQEMIYCDREKIEIALYNLVANALKYTPSGGNIAVVVSSTAENVSVSVSDSGPGISANAQEKLFLQFFQANDSHVKSGFGIGLYVAQTFAHLHKGKITCESEPNKGAVFLLQIPKGNTHFDAGTIFQDKLGSSVFLHELAEEEEPKPESDAGPDKINQIGAEEAFTQPLDAVMGEITLDKPVMLIVDDSHEIRHYIAQVFSSKFTLHEAADGKDGIVLARTYMPDIILSDVVMEGGNGIEFCMALKSDDALRHIPIILLTATSAADIKLKGIELGADDYITKPFDKDLLVARVHNLLEKRNSLQQYFFNEVTLQQNNLKISEEYKQFLDRCIAIVEANIDNDDFSVKHLASEVGMSHSNLYKKVKAISGQSVSSFIRFIRLRNAASIMVNSQCNVNEAAFQAGISDVKYFRKQFHKLFGMNPTDYIKKYRRPFQKQYSLNEKAVK